MGATGVGVLAVLLGAALGAPRASALAAVGRLPVARAPPRAMAAAPRGARAPTTAARVAAARRRAAPRMVAVETPPGGITPSDPSKPPFDTVLVANRGEIAIRICRAVHELGGRAIAIYSREDAYAKHRRTADAAYLLNPEGSGLSPVGSYLDIPRIVAAAKEMGAQAIHPGYGFLSENAKFAQACADNGLVFIGPTPQTIQEFGSKTDARKMAIEAGLPVIPGSAALADVGEAVAFAEEVGFPLMVKATMGGGGKGMRIVRDMAQLKAGVPAAISEALAAFGDGTVFLERYIERPRHVEVQVLGDGTGDVVHLYERDCSVQRRHQKVVEIAPALGLSDELRHALYADAVKIAKATKYRAAGTVEFLVDQKGRHYFIEVNPRIQVEHTITEEVTGIDLVQAQIRIAAGATLRDLGISQERIMLRGVAIQCRITTEDPCDNFRPDTGTITMYRSSAGPGIRLDGVGYTGLTISPHYDSLLTKVTARADSWGAAVSRMRRALQEFTIDGVQTNIPFLLAMMTDELFISGNVDTSYIEQRGPSLLERAKLGGPAETSGTAIKASDQTDLIAKYLAHVAVNGQPKSLGAHPGVRASVRAVPPPKLPDMLRAESAPAGWRQVLLREGPAGFARAVRAHKGLLLTDTTWRDAHQSLLATRMRTCDILKAAPATDVALRNAFSLEMWGGATYDVSMRFLREDPWDRLRALRAAAPSVPFQMLLRGANAVGYTSYPDNVVKKFCKLAVKDGIDVFRIFDSLNYLENMKLGIDAVGEAGGVIEATLCYTGDLCDPTKRKYSLEYYLNYARELVALGVHMLAVKDMAGLLKPAAAQMLVSALRAEFPDLPIHVHTHDTAGTGVASMLAAAHAGADVVDCAIDGLSGMTSQPSMGALIGATAGTALDTGISLRHTEGLNEYWEQVRQMYAPFESGQLSGSADVYLNEIPGGQYTNLLFQTRQLGLAGRWSQVKRAYTQANLLLGDVIKVTPSSKVVGDLANFMVANNLRPDELVERAADLDFPDSVLQYLRGEIGTPPGGFPEPLRTRALKGARSIVGRPGASLPPFDFDAAAKYLAARFNTAVISEEDVVSHALYPTVFDDFLNHQLKYGNVSLIPTSAFLHSLELGEAVQFIDNAGKESEVKMLGVTPPLANGICSVLLEINGEPRIVSVRDSKLAPKSGTKGEKADPIDDGSVGSPLSGVVVALKVDKGDTVEKGQPIAVMSAMKMETTVTAPITGVVERLAVSAGASIEVGDLIVYIKGGADFIASKQN
ncbi:hypothetical protein KFE25_004903 [Diacronema lutheri]|uniref:pyruvate carboxylase n=4 Tax=Diacronema lutheri TaxID=2081491 RepID=A0A8J5XGC9_DIALT|nr:hypothetical protein KFE25_004903 [Diacronema lutheri]